MDSIVMRNTKVGKIQSVESEKYAEDGVTMVVDVRLVKSS